jgi:hypothetical protein
VFRRRQLRQRDCPGRRSGIAREAGDGRGLSLLLLLGVEVWPGVLVGVFLAAITAREPALVALATAAGIALEALSPPGSFCRFAGLDRTLARCGRRWAWCCSARSPVPRSARRLESQVCVSAAFDPGPRSVSRGAAGGLKRHRRSVVVPALLTWHAWLDAPRRRIVETALLLIGCWH